MNRKTAVFSVLVLLPFLQAGGGQAVSRLPADLRETIQAFYESIETDDYEARIALFSEDALMLPNHGEKIVGKEAIAEVLRSGEGWTFRLRDRVTLDTDVDGGIAYTVNAYDYTYHPAGEEPTWHPTKNVHIWKRNAQGDWKLHVDLWNADDP